MNVNLLEPGGEFTVFYDSEPGPRDWSDPGTFSEGVPIALFEESALLNTQASGSFPGTSFNAFSSRLIDSAPINFYGQKLDFNRVVPNGVTITNFCNGIRFFPGPGANCGATAFAIGGNFR